MPSDRRRALNSIFWRLSVCLGVIFALSGCISTASYQIISKQVGSRQTKISVDVPATSTQGNMQVWANHLETLYKTDGKPLMIDFFANESGAHRLIGTYQGSSVQRVR